MASFVQRWADRPEAAEAGRMWDAVNLSRTMEVTDDESFGRYLKGILPAYFADYRKTVEQTGSDLTLQVTHDPNRLPAPWDVRDQLGAIKVPALVIVGTYDFICPPGFAYEMHAGMPDVGRPSCARAATSATLNSRMSSPPPCWNFVRQPRDGAAGMTTSSRSDWRRQTEIRAYADLVTGAPTPSAGVAGHRLAARRLGARARAS